MGLVTEEAMVGLRLRQERFSQDTTIGRLNVRWPKGLYTSGIFIAPNSIQPTLTDRPAADTWLGGWLMARFCL